MKELSEYGTEIAKDRYFWSNENTWMDLTTRVSRENVKNERNDQDKWYEEFYDIIGNMYFIPGGRILRNIGKLKPSTSNCNFLSIGDSIESIGETLANYMTISSYGGGTGLNFSTLRPKGATLVTKGGKSTGMLSFLEIFDYAGQRIETGGQRRAAGICLLDVSHPEIIDFINAKVKHDKLTQFNISVIITSSFLKAVESNDSWEFKFAGKSFGSMMARDLWNLILTNMLEHGEPGLVNWDNLRKNNTYSFSQIEGTNPCSELPLENLGVCNLGSLVLPNFITGKRTDWQKLSRVIKLSVRYLDNIIDLAYYPITGQEIVVKNARRLGLGTMGLSDYLFTKEIRYGSEQSLVEIDKLYKFIRDEAYIASCELAKEKGAFPKFDKVDFMNASFVRKLPLKIRRMIKEYSIRNSVLITSPPTGSTSLLAGVVSGIEPLPFRGYKRVDGVGERVYVHPLCKTSFNEEWFVDSTDLKPEDHLEVQALIQKYSCNGVSKTVLIPENMTVDNLSEVLLEAIKDLKGVAVYRDNSRKEQIYYKLSKKEIREYIDKSDTFKELDADDVSCKDGMCEI